MLENQYLAIVNISKYAYSSLDYRFNGKELDPETGNYYYGARYYDPKISIWLSVDPILKHHESPYSFMSGNPIMIMDPDGRDTILYNQQGEILRQIPAEGDHTHFLQHEDGNRSIGGGTYYQGLSRESFFGDRADNNGMFTEIDERFNQNHEWKFFAIARDHKDKDHSVGDFIKESPENQHYDFKNSNYINKQDHPTRVFMVNGMLMNSNEVGNILWGATAGSFGFSSFGARYGANLFTLYDEGRSDERGEQIAIHIGVTIWNKFNK